jgi:regulator of protease activity HflC (stomatin/prohibitin superfamily)
LLALLPSLVLINPQQMGIRITGGGHFKVVKPGWYFIWPLIQSMEIKDVNTKVLNLAAQSCHSKDGKEVVAGSTVRFRITDIVKAVFAVQDVEEAIGNTTLGVILEFVSSRPFTDCFDIEGLKKELRKALAEESSGWGIKIERIAVTDIGETQNFRLFADGFKL